MNKLRLEKLKVKIECVNNVFEEAKTHLINRIKNKPNDYKVVIKNIIIQGLIKLLEENVNIVCKKTDFDLVTSVLEQAKTEFLELLKREAKKFKNFNVNITVDTKYYLPETVYYKHILIISIGGLVLSAQRSKIRIDNTLDKRLELLKQTATPEIRKLLFKNTDH